MNSSRKYVKKEAKKQGNVHAREVGRKQIRTMKESSKDIGKCVYMKISKELARFSSKKASVEVGKKNARKVGRN